jgi:hypothetical protein
MKTFYRWVDGHTYWKTEDGWMGAPTFKDSTPDVENGCHTADFDLSADEIKGLEAELDARNEGEDEYEDEPDYPDPGEVADQRLLRQDDPLQRDQPETCTEQERTER